MSKNTNYTLSQLPKELKEMLPGDTFKIKGQEFIWELYDYSPGFYWVKNTISKQKILIQITC